MFLTLEISCTASAPISASMDVASFECTAWVSTCSFEHSPPKWTRVPIATFTIVQLIVQWASQNWTMHNQSSHLWHQHWLQRPPLHLRQLLNPTTTTTIIQTTSLTHLIGLNAPPPLSPAAIDLNTNPTTAFTKSLKDMNGENLVKLLFTDTAPTGSSPPVGQPKHKARDPLVCMDEKDIIELLHKSGSSPPPIRPCDTSNPSNTKLHWTAKELHCIMGFS